MTVTEVKKNAVTGSISMATLLKGCRFDRLRRKE